MPNDLVGLPPLGCGPKRKPMLQAWLAPGACASSRLVRAYKLYGAIRLKLRKKPLRFGAYRLTTCACLTTGTSLGCAPDQANAGRPNSRSNCRSSSLALRTGPITVGKCEENTAIIRLSPPSTGSKYTMSALVNPVCGRANTMLSIFTASTGRGPAACSPVNGDTRPAEQPPPASGSEQPGNSAPNAAMTATVTAAEKVGDSSFRIKGRCPGARTLHMLPSTPGQGRLR